MQPHRALDPTAALLIRPTLKIAGGFISISYLGEDLVEVHERRLEVKGTPDHEWPGLVELVEQKMAAGELRFIVDLQRVPWMNSRGLGRLIELWRLIGAGGGRVALVCRPGRILTILEISQLTQVMKPCLNLADAMRALNTPLT